MGWLELFRSLGTSIIEVFRAELDALKEELSRSGRHLAIGLALLGVAFVLLFWTLGALIFALGAVLAIWLQPWAAALVVVAIFTLAATLVAWRGWKRLERFDNPVESIRRRLEDHLEWWQHTMLKEERPIDLPPTGAPASPRERTREGRDLS
jgi:Putative Actinobacterial Holin-X, holin superfamily III